MNFHFHNYSGIKFGVSTSSLFYLTVFLLSNDSSDEFYIGSFGFIAETFHGLAAAGSDLLECIALHINAS